MEPFGAASGPGKTLSPLQSPNLEAMAGIHDLKSLKRKFEIPRHEETDDPKSKLPKQSNYHGASYKAPGVPPGYLVVHQVTCNRAGEHYNHIASASYLDVPRLFAADSKANTLRGRISLPSIDEYFDNHPGVTILISKHYSCQEYFKTVEDGFERLPIPKLDSNVLAHIRTNFFVLKNGGEPAQAISENMQILSRDLQSALGEFGLPNNIQEMTAPYLEIYRKIEQPPIQISEPPHGFSY
jgi:hypothetical protein